MLKHVITSVAQLQRILLNLNFNHPVLSIINNIFKGQSAEIVIVKFVKEGQCNLRKTLSTASSASWSKWLCQIPHGNMNL